MKWDNRIAILHIIVKNVARHLSYPKYELSGNGLAHICISNRIVIFDVIFPIRDWKEFKTEILILGTWNLILPNHCLKFLKSILTLNSFWSCPRTIGQMHFCRRYYFYITISIWYIPNYIEITKISLFLNFFTDYCSVIVLRVYVQLK